MLYIYTSFSNSEITGEVLHVGNFLRLMDRAKNILKSFLRSVEHWTEMF
jgi:hypothetical protein